MLKTDKIAGVVVLYNPDESVGRNISNYCNQLDCLYVVDNSEKPNGFIPEKFIGHTKIKYFQFGENLGIAKALNIAVHNAINDGYSFLLTMDQDSTLSNNTIGEYRKHVVRYNNDEIGILTLRQRVKNFLVHRLDNSTEIVQTAFTSGSLMNLEAFAKVGPFEEKLFIDYVDHEYCLRLRKMNYKIVRLNSVYCDHQLGNLETRKIFGFIIPITHHSPLRHYYRTRNRIYVASLYYRKFPFWVASDIIRFFYETLIVILFEPQKKIKIIMILKGFNDCFHGQYGKI
ncbi:MAG: glycosyltransferase family 2 protein [Bacteroidota bacterium]|nr:glycosyltransferase family 2 protein [Bacteroidota bacterium]